MKFWIIFAAIELVGLLLCIALVAWLGFGYQPLMAFLVAFPFGFGWLAVAWWGALLLTGEPE